MAVPALHLTPIAVAAFAGWAASLLAFFTIAVIRYCCERWPLPQRAEGRTWSEEPSPTEKGFDQHQHQYRNSESLSEPPESEYPRGRNDDTGSVSDFQGQRNENDYGQHDENDYGQHNGDDYGQHGGDDYGQNDEDAHGRFGNEDSDEHYDSDAPPGSYAPDDQYETGREDIDGSDGYSDRSDGQHSPGSPR